MNNLLPLIGAVFVFGLIGYWIGDLTGFVIGLFLGVIGAVSKFIEDSKSHSFSDNDLDFPELPTPEESEKIFSKKPGLLKTFFKLRQSESTRLVKKGEMLFKATCFEDSKRLILSYNRKISPTYETLHISVFFVYKDAIKRNKHVYIDAWCYERDAFRTYRIDRIIGAFSPDTGEEVKDINSLLSILNSNPSFD